MLSDQQMSKGNRYFFRTKLVGLGGTGDGERSTAYMLRILSDGKILQTNRGNLPK